MPTQPTPEAASPLVTPPALAPIGSTNLNSTPNGINSEIAVITTDERMVETLPETKQKKDDPLENDFDNEGRQGDVKQHENKQKTRKITKTETPPRFQTRKESDERGKNTEGRKTRTSRQVGGEKNAQKRSLDRSRKVRVK